MKQRAATSGERAALTSGQIGLMVAALVLSVLKPRPLETGPVSRRLRH